MKLNRGRLSQVLLLLLTFFNLSFPGFARGLPRVFRVDGVSSNWSI